MDTSRTNNNTTSVSRRSSFRTPPETAILPEVLSPVEVSREVKAAEVKAAVEAAEVKAAVEAAESQDPNFLQPDSIKFIDSQERFFFLSVNSI